jgi:hypothetical protein
VEPTVLPALTQRLNEVFQAVASDWGRH